MTSEDACILRDYVRGERFCCRAHACELSHALTFDLQTLLSDSRKMAVPKVSISTQEAAACVEFSPYEESSDLLAIGSKSRVTVKAWPLQV